MSILVVKYFILMNRPLGLEQGLAFIGTSDRKGWSFQNVVVQTDTD